MVPSHFLFLFCLQLIGTRPDLHTDPPARSVPIFKTRLNPEKRLHHERRG